jgi:hypothetical protein
LNAAADGARHYSVGKRVTDVGNDFAVVVVGNDFAFEVDNDVFVVDNDVVVAVVADNDDRRSDIVVEVIADVVGDDACPVPTMTAVRSPNVLPALYVELEKFRLVQI